MSEPRQTAKCKLEIICCKTKFEPIVQIRLKKISTVFDVPKDCLDNKLFEIRSSLFYSMYAIII